MPLKETGKAYLAGIVDGEGTVTLAKDRKNQTPTASASVANNDLKLLQWAKKRVGGGPLFQKRNGWFTTAIHALGRLIRTEL